MKLRFLVKILCVILVLFASLSLSGYFLDFEWQNKFKDYPVSVKILSVVSFIINLGFFILGNFILFIGYKFRKLLVQLTILDNLHIILGTIIYSKHYLITTKEYRQIFLGLVFNTLIICFFTRKNLKTLFSDFQAD